MKTVKLSEVKHGGIFKILDVEFIKFTLDEKTSIAVTKNTVFDSAFGKNNNNLAESVVLERLTKEFLPKIISAVGEENVLEFETDLTTLDGLKPYEPLKSKISLPTFDFYRSNVETFDKYQLDEWWWLSTPDTAQPHYNPVWVVCVSPLGNFLNNYFDNINGVRPFLHFDSSISVSCEEE